MNPSSLFHIFMLYLSRPDLVNKKGLTTMFTKSSFVYITIYALIAILHIILKCACAEIFFYKVQNMFVL